MAAVGSKAKDVRVIGSGPKAGEEFTVEVPTYVSAMAQFESGAPPAEVSVPNTLFLRNAEIEGRFPQALAAVSGL